jgi:alcohol dehydrogenase class IV
MVRFTLPRDLYHGKGALEALKTLKGKKAIICVGGGSRRSEPQYSESCSEYSRR